MDEDAGSFLGECSGDSSLSSGFFFFPVFCFLDGLPGVSSCSSVGSSISSPWSSASGFVRIAGGEGTTTVGRIGWDDCDCDGKETSPPSRLSPLEDEMDCFCRVSAESPLPGLSCGGSGGSTGLSGDTLRGAGGMG